MLSPPAFRRILIVPLRYIGDTILTVPLIRNLRHTYPEAHIDLLASTVTAPLMDVCPYLNRVLIEPKGTGARFKLLQDGHYDAVFILRKSFTFALMSQLAGIRHRIGYDKQRFPFGYKRWGVCLSRRARYPSLRTDVPQPVSHLGLLLAARVPVHDDFLELWTTPDDEQQVDQRFQTHHLSSQKPLAVLHAASASHGKQIELSRFVESLQALHQAGYQLAASGTKNDWEGYEALKAEANVPLVNLAGQTSLRETFALYKRTQLLLTVDSSPIHLGAAAGIPKIVGVFGPTNERQWGPHNPTVDFRPVFKDLPCRPCYAKVCSHNNCRELLTGNDLANAVQDLVNPSG